MTGPTFLCSHISEVCLCGAPAAYLCDAPRAWWEIADVVELYAQGKALAASYEAAGASERRMIAREVRGINAEMVRIMADGPPVVRTCSAPVCAACALTIGEDEHLCPACAEPWRRAEQRTSWRRCERAGWA
jgi:hypothetical protein